MTAEQPRLRQRPLLLVEALLALTLASILIAVLPFRSVARLAAGTGDGAGAGAVPVDAAGAPEAQWIAQAIAAWGAYVPWRTVCFQQGLAALLMLRRRRKAATLYYGAAHGDAARLVAHVWVRSGGTDVIGCETADNFGVLATFPDRANNAD